MKCEWILLVYWVLYVNVCMDMDWLDAKFFHIENYVSLKYYLAPQTMISDIELLYITHNTV